MAGLSEIYLPKHSLSEMMRSCQSKMSALTYNRGHWVLLQLSHPLQLYKITAVPHLSHSLQLYKITVVPHLSHSLQLFKITVVPTFIVADLFYFYLIIPSNISWQIIQHIQYLQQLLCFTICMYLFICGR